MLKETSVVSGRFYTRLMRGDEKKGWQSSLTIKYPGRKHIHLHLFHESSRGDWHTQEFDVDIHQAEILYERLGRIIKEMHKRNP